ncbi:calcium-activated potassium channel subunit beta-4-like [Oscarella lobularis]|uniref:calcium-activated potassium channel subunit beta-4-like n=1 Tax=Oscarella lobularis TaxID=121494 RepID=UPI003313DA99
MATATDRVRCCCPLYGALVVLTVIALSLVGALVLRPYVQVLHYEHSTCTVTVVRKAKDITCSCDEGCTSQYPCYTVQVNYTTVDGMKKSAAIYENEEVLLQGKCAFTTFCHRFSSANGRNIREKLSKRGQIGTEYTCYYNPLKHSEAIMDKKFSLLAVVSAMLFPSLIFVISLALCLYSTKGNKWCTKKRQEEVATVTANSNQLRVVEDKLPNSNQVVQSDNLAQPPTYMESINM